LSYVIQRLNGIDLENDSVVVLHCTREHVQNLSSHLLANGFRPVLLREDADEYPQSGVFLSTLHSAKGLEFDHVIIVGYDDFFSPGSISHRETSAHLSAHRQLLYTALSRARNTLLITSSHDQYSRFLNDIDHNLLTLVENA